MGEVADKIKASLDEFLREEEIVSEVSTGRYAVALPGTKIFKANIVANRLQLAIEKLTFQFADGNKKFRLAIGLTSTQPCDAETKYLTFGEYCIQARHALNMSTESRNNHIVRYDETYEMMVQNDSSHGQSKDKKDLVKVEKEENIICEAADTGDMFSDILNGDYNNIPAATLAELIEPLEKFLTHAKCASEHADIKKAG